MTVPFSFLAPPPPIARAILQPSLHARGARPFVFAGRMDDWHAPGILTSRSNNTHSAVDAAWLCERVLGKPRHAPAMWPGVPGARERAVALGRQAGQTGIAEFQQEGAAFLAERDYALLVDQMGCLGAETKVQLQFRDELELSSSLATLHRVWTERGGVGRDLPKILSLGDEQAFTYHDIEAVLYRGKREVVRAVFASGRELFITPDHEIRLAGIERYEAVSRLYMAFVQAENGADQLVSAEPAGIMDVYDVVCAEPYRNFVANGIVVHNCGKTPQAIVAAEARLSMASIPTPTTPVVLIVCPAVAKRHWQAELKKWIGAESVVLDTLTPDPEQLTARYVICNYDILYGGQKRDAAGVVFDVAHLPGWGQTLANRFLITIFDEAHVLRGRSSRRTKAAKALCAHVPVVWALTGTPMPNYVRDLYSLVDVVSGGLFDVSYWKWAKAYTNAAQGQYGWSDSGSSRLDELQARLGFFTLGRTAESVHLQLPEKRREVFRVDVEITAPTVHEGRAALNQNQAVMSALRRTAFAKRPAVVSAAVEALQSKQKVVVFVYMREQADAIAKDVRKHVDCTVFCVHGDLTPDGRYAQAQQFRETSAPACFVATIDSMGVALSLVGANLMLFGDVVPEPWKMLQAEKRGHRFDSKVRLLVRYFIATGTIDEGIAEAVIAKIPIIEQTLGAQSDSDEMVKMLGGKSSEEIVASLFAKLKAWGGSGGG